MKKFILTIRKPDGTIYKMIKSDDTKILCRRYDREIKTGKDFNMVSRYKATVEITESGNIYDMSDFYYAFMQ